MNQAISTFRGGTVGLAATAAMWCGAVAWGAGGAPGTGSEADELAILQSEASPADKALACKRLAVVGSADAVDELAPLLADPQLASWARIALQAIEGPEAGEALRAALQRVSGRERIGIINTLGVRREAAAAPALLELLRQQDDAEAASAAAVTLGRIGGEAAATALGQALADSRPQVRSAAAEGCVLWAEQLAARGDAAAAKALYEQVLQASAPEQRHLEARRGRILASGVDGGKLLVEELAAAAPARLPWG